VTPLDDPCRRWTRDLLALKSKAARAAKTADPRVADLLREALAACDGLMQDLQIMTVEQSQLSERLVAAGTEWSTLLDRLPCPCVCTDGTGFILKANAAAASLLAITSRHLDARLLTHFAEDRDQFSRALRRAAWDRVEVHERMSIRPRDRAPVLVDAVVMPKSPDDNTTILWFLQPPSDRAGVSKGARRPSPRTNAARPLTAGAIPTDAAQTA
jgi:PAS domain-containing protein